MVKNLPTVWETWVRILGWEDPLEKEMATHSNNSHLENPRGQRSLADYSPWGCKESDMIQQLSTHTHTHTHTHTPSSHHPFRVAVVGSISGRQMVGRHVRAHLCENASIWSHQTARETGKHSSAVWGSGERGEGVLWAACHLYHMHHTNSASAK